jgi:hypothetical protein
MRKKSQGPAHKLMLLPNANKAMVAAPSSGWLVKAATIKAEYSKPQGMRAHSPPTIQGAARPQRVVNARTFAHSPLAAPSSQRGCRACNRSTTPRLNAAKWSKVQTGRMAADWVVSQPKPCTLAAARAPSNEYPAKRPS